MNYNEYKANIKAYKAGTLLHAEPADAVSDWHEKYFDAAVSALSKKMVADHVQHSEDSDRFGKDFVSMVAIMEEDGISKTDIGNELAAVSKAAQAQADAAIKKIDAVQHSTDTLEGYQAAIRAYKDRLEHGEWKKHKYIRIENGRYIYPEDVKKSGGTQVTGKQAVKNKVSETLNAFKTAGQKIGQSVQDTKSSAEKEQLKAYGEARKAGRQETIKQQVINDVAKYDAKNEAKSYVSGTKNDKDIYNDLGVHSKDTIDYLKSKGLGKYGINEKEVAAEVEKKSLDNYRDEYKAAKDEVKGREEMTKAMKDARKATAEYKESGQHEKDVASEKEKSEKAALAEKNKKEFDESTKQLSPQEQYKKEQAEKAAAERKEINGKQVLQDVKTKNLGMKIDMAGEEAISNLQKERESRDAGRKAVSEKKERESLGLNKTNEDLAKKYNLSNEQIDNALQMAKHRKDVAEHDLSLEAHKRANDINGNIQETESGWVISDRKGNLIAKYEKPASLEDYVKTEIESENKVNSYEKEYEKYGLTREQLKSAIKEAENSYDKKLSSYGSSAYSRANRTGGNVTKHSSGNGWSVVDNNGNIIAEYPIESLNQFIDKACKELVAKKKVQHSDPREAFYAAIDAYKAQHGTQRVPL